MAEEDQDSLSNAMQQMSVDGEDDDDVQAGAPLARLLSIEENVEKKEKRTEVLLSETKAYLKQTIEREKGLKKMLKEMKETGKRVYISSDTPADDYPDDPADKEDAKDLDYSPAASSAKTKKPPKKKPTTVVTAPPPPPAEGKIAVLFYVCKDKQGNIFIPREGTFFFDFESEAQGAKIVAAALEWEEKQSWEILIKMGSNIDVVRSQLPTKLCGIDHGFKNR